jgi:excinuclease UvrABC nuclease subunit
VRLPKRQCTLKSHSVCSPERSEGSHKKAVLDVLYNDDNYEKAWGFRLLAIDGSKIHLPNTAEIIQEFGVSTPVPTLGGI